MTHIFDVAYSNAPERDFWGWGGGGGGGGRPPPPHTPNFPFTHT
jgi:hypothetical protein